MRGGSSRGRLEGGGEKLGSSVGGASCSGVVGLYSATGIGVCTADCARVFESVCEE